MKAERTGPVLPDWIYDTHTGVKANELKVAVIGPGSPSTTTAYTNSTFK